MSVQESAAIKAYRERVDNAIIAWARGLRDTIHEISDEMLTTLAERPEEIDRLVRDSWRDAS